MNAPYTHKLDLRSGTLYHITADFLALEDLLEQQSAGGTEADASIVAGWLEELSGKLEHKAEGVIRYVRTQEALRDALIEEAERLRSRAAVHDNRVRALKEAMRAAMAVAGTKKIETPAGVVSIAGNGGKQPVALLVPLEQVPDEVCRLERKIDDEKLRAALEAAGGETHYAVLQARGNHVRIK